MRGNREGRRLVCLCGQGDMLKRPRYETCRLVLDDLKHLPDLAETLSPHVRNLAVQRRKTWWNLIHRRKEKVDNLIWG